MKKTASDFRSIARESLEGNWLKAGIVALIASILGGNLYISGFNLDINLNSTETSSTQGMLLGTSETNDFLTYAVLIAFVMFGISLIIGGFVALGNAKFQLSLIDRKESNISDIFSQSDRFCDGFKMKFWIGLKVFLWSLVLVIPGIVKQYSYAMTPYIMYEYPECIVEDAMNQSQEMMYGNKWRLFCLHFSFIGWELLLVVISGFGIAGGLFGFVSMLGILLNLVAVLIAEFILAAYQEAAQAAFYREISATIATKNQEAIIEVEVDESLI